MGKVCLYHEVLISDEISKECIVGMDFLTRSDEIKNNLNNIKRILSEYVNENREIYEKNTENEPSNLEIDDVLKEFESLFSKGSNDLGRTHIVEHEIELVDEIPIRQQVRRIPPHFKAEFEKQLQDMLEAGIIEESQSAWSSPVVLVRKSDGSLRTCIDYRKLNEKTVKNSYPMPRIDDTLDQLNGSKIFSRHQVTTKSQ